MKFQVTFIGSWFDPPKAKETALAQIDAGADVMYAERFGVSDAAKEKGILAIGNVIDTQADYPDTVVASALWHFEPTLDRAIAKVKDGSFTAEDYGQYSFMKHGGCSLAPLGTFEGKVPAEVMAKVAEREKAIPRRRLHGRDQRQRAEVARKVTGSTAAAEPEVVLRLSRHHQALRPAHRQRSHQLRASGAARCVALLGENGAGKTTLMNILFGHYVADDGRDRGVRTCRCRRARRAPPSPPASAWCTSISPWPRT